MADVILSASMSNEELLNSIDNALGKAEKKFDSFTSKINGKLSKVGTGSSKGGSGTVNVDELNAAKQKTAEEKVTLEVLRREKILEKERTLRAQIAAESERAAQAESRARVAAGGSSYDSAMAMSATTIQQRIEKIKALQNVQRNLSNSDVNYATQLNSVNREMGNLKKANQAALTSGMALEKHNNKLVTSFENLFRRVIFYTGLGAITSFVKQIYTIRGEYEMLEVSMGALVGDFAKGSQIFNTIKTQALKSPFTVADLEGAAKQLIAYNFQLSTVADTTRRLGDISSALGVPMERIVYNLGQIKAQGVLNARDARDFANAGLAIVPMLAQLYTEQKRNGDQAVTTAQVYDMMSKKLVSYGDVMSVINKVTDEGGMFFNFQAKQAETLKGQLSNLVDAWNNMLNEIGKDNQGLLTGSVSLIRTLFSNWREVASAIESLVIAYGAYKVVQLTANSLIGHGNLMLTKSVLMDKRKIASELEREGTTRTLTDVERAYIANRNVATAADYKASLMSKNLSKSQLLLLAALNSSNTSMLQAIMRIGGLTAAEVKAVLGLKGLAFAGKVAMLSLKSLWATVKSLAISFAPMLILSAVIELFVNASAKADEQKQKIKELSDSYAELSRSISDISASFNFSINKNGGDGLDEAKTKLEELVKLAKDQFGIVIDVDTSKLDAKEVAKKFYDIKKELEGMEVASRAFAEVAVNTGLNKEWEKYGDNIQKVSDDIYVTKGVVADALQKHIDKLKAVGASQKVVQDEQKVLNQLMMPQQANESQIDYLSRLLNAYEQIGIVGSMSTMFDPMVDKLRLLGITGMDTFKTLSNDYKDFVDSGEDASKKFDEQVEQLAKKINFSALSKEERTIQLEAAINKNATDQNLTEAGRQMMIKIANFKFGTSIKVHTDDGSLKQTEFDIKSWQGRLQDWANKNGITLGFFLTTGMTEAQGASAALQKWKDAQKEYETILNKFNYYKTSEGQRDVKKYKLTPTPWEDVAEAKKNMDKAYKAAFPAGVSPSDLITKQEKKNAKERAKDARETESELSRAIKNEIDLIDKLSGNYDKLTKAGMSSADATSLLSKEYSKSIGSINAVLAKNKLPIFNIGDFTGKDAKGQLDYLEELRSELKKRGFGKKEQNLINEISIKIQKLTVDAETYNLDKIKEGLEESLSNIKESYELGIEIEESGEVGKLFKDIFKIDDSQIITNVVDAIHRIQKETDKAIEQYKDGNKGSGFSFNVTSDNPQKIAEQFGLSVDSGIIKVLESARTSVIDLYKKAMNNGVKDFSEFTKSVEIQKSLVEKNFKTFIDFLDTSGLDKTSKEYLDKRKNAENIRSRKLLEIDFQSFKGTEDYAKAFGDLDNTSIATISAVASQLDKFKAAALSVGDVVNAKEYVSQIQKLYDTINSRRNIFEEFKLALKEYNSATKDLANYPDNRDVLDNYEKSANRLKKSISALRTVIKEFGSQFGNVIGNIFGGDLSSQVQMIFNLGDAFLEVKDKLTGIAEISTDAIDKVGEAANSIQSSVTDTTKEAMDNIGTAVQGVGSGMEKTAQTASTAISTMEKASVILAVISAALQILNAISNIDSKYKEEQKAMLDALTSSQLEYNKSLLETKLLHEDVFGANPFGNIVSDIRGAKDAMDNYNATANTLQEKWTDPKHGFFSNLNSAWQAFSKQNPLNYILDSLGKVGDGIKKVINITSGASLGDELFKGLANLGTSPNSGWVKAIDNLRYITQQGSKGFLGIGSKGTQTEDLKKWVKENFGTELFGKNGLIDLTIANELLTKHADRLTDDTRKALESLKTYAEEIKKIEDSVNQWAAGVFGDLATNLSDALINSFRNGKSAASDFETYVAKVFENLGAQMIQSMLYGQVFNKYQTKLQDLTNKYAMGGFEDEKAYMNAMAELTANIMKDSKNFIGVGEDFLKSLQDSAAVYGIKTFQPDSTSGLSALQQGIQSITEETGGAIESYLNNFSGQIYLHTSQLAQLVNNSNIGLGTMSQMLLQLQQSHQVQMAIQGILIGWSSNNGRSVRVEMI